MSTLQPGSILQGGKYKILGTLGQGGFGITYLAEQTMLDGKVAVKEFFFKDYCDRDADTSHVTITTKTNRELVERFKQKFVKEARTLFRLSHSNIVRILDVFEENDTAYYVMEYIEGESLGDMVKRRGALPEAEALGYIRSVAKTLQFMHGKNMNHLDIKPSNLMKRNDDGEIIVIDFGTTKQYDAKTSEGTTTTPVGISHGYSPTEQYRKNGVQSFSPQSDVYALAATLFKLLTGNTPPEAMEVQDEGLPVGELTAKGVSANVIASIQLAMKGRHERTQSIAEFLSNLDNKSLSADDDEATVLTAESQKKEDERLRNEAEAKAAKEKAEAEARAKAEAERKAREEAERKKHEAEEAARKVAENAERKKKMTWIAISVVVIIAAIIGVSQMGGDSANATAEANQTVTAGEKVQNKTIVLTKGHESKRNFIYSGEVDADGLPHGQGEAQYPETKSSGSCTFKGTFEHGITSNGEMAFSNGTKYKGTFTADGFFKEGTWTETDGYYFKGTFKNGDPYNGTWYTPQGAEDSKVVNGQ